MKPGNLQCKVPNPAATRDEDSILRTSNARCAVFYYGKPLKNNINALRIFFLRTARTKA